MFLHVFEFVANHLCVFFVRPGPVRLVALLPLRRNASLAGGFAGRLGLGCVVVCDDLPF